MLILQNIIPTNDKIAAIDKHNFKLKYSDIFYYSEDFKAIIKKRSLIFILCENSIGALAGYISFLKLNCVPVLLDRNIDIELYNNLVEIYKPNYIYKPEEMLLQGNKEVVCMNKYGYVLINCNNIEKKMYADLGLLLTT